MRQVRPSENWRRQLLLLEAGESDFIGTSGKKDLPRQTTAGRHRDTESTKGGTVEILVLGLLLRDALCLGAEFYREDCTVVDTTLST